MRTFCTDSRSRVPQLRRQLTPTRVVRSRSPAQRLHALTTSLTVERSDEFVMHTPLEYKGTANAWHTQTFSSRVWMERPQVQGYVLTNYLGEGGMGEVREAHSVLGSEEFALNAEGALENRERRVAVKSLHSMFTHPDSNQNKAKARKKLELLIPYARKEAEILEKCEHPNVVGWIGTEERKDQFHLIEEFAEGKDLNEWIKDKKEKFATSAQLYERRAAWLILRCLQGVRALHAAGFVHNDLKPSNILVRGARVKIIDLGVAAQIGEARTRRTGTFSSQSPEQLEKQPVDPRDDIYSLGVILYFMLTRGQAHFEDLTTDVEMADKEPQYWISKRINHILEELCTCGGDPRENPKVIEEGIKISDRLAEIVMKAMAYTRMERYQSADEFIEALEGFLKLR